MAEASTQQLSEAEFFTQALSAAAPNLFDSDELSTGRIQKALKNSSGGSVILKDSHSEMEFLEHPYDMVSAGNMRYQNSHHTAALELLPNMVVGKGIASSKVSDLLDPLCASGDFEVEMTQVIDNRNEFGWGVLEIVRQRTQRNELGAIVSINALKPQFTYLRRPYVGDYRNRLDLTGLARAQSLNVNGAISVNVHEVTSVTAGSTAYSPGGMGTVHAPFGKREDFYKAFGVEKSDAKSQVAEYILFPRRGNVAEGYPMPRWLAAAAYIELNQMQLKHVWDYAYNNGMPHWFFIAKNMSKPMFRALQAEVQDRHTGLGQRSRGLFVNLQSKEQEIALEQLQDSPPTENFPEQSQEIGANILSAHGAPAKLAGALVQGKLGSTNDIAVDAMFYEHSTACRERRLVSRVLARTLGNPQLNGGLDLTPDDFRSSSDGTAFDPAWTAEVIQTMAGAQRQSDPVGSGRDPSEGAAANGQQRSSQST